MTTRSKVKVAKKTTPKKKAATGDEALAKKLLATSSPDKVIAKLKIEERVLWRLLANGLVPLASPIAGVAYNYMDTIDATPVIAAAKRLAPDAMHDNGTRFVLSKSYGAHPTAWEAERELPLVVLDMLAPDRVKHGVAISVEDRDRVLEFYARAAFDPAARFRNLAQIVSPLEAEPIWSKRLLAMIDANPELPITNASTLAFRHSTWDRFHAYCARDYQTARGGSVEEVLEVLDHTSEQLFALRALGGEIEAGIAWEIFAHAFARGEVPPAGLEDAVLEDYACSWSTLDNAASLNALPKKRFEAFAAKVREKAEPRPELAGILKDKKLDAEIVERIVEAATGEWSDMHDSIMSVLRDVLPSQLHAITLMERAYAKIEKSRENFDATYEGIKLRNLFRRVKFMATRGQKDRPYELVMPSEELVWADHVGDMIGADDATSMMPLDEMNRLLDAYIPYDWDDSLRFENYFDKRVEKKIEAIVRPPIETRPWAELAKLVALTSFQRLEDGESQNQTLTKVLSRSEPLADRIALVAAIAERERPYTAANPGDLRGLRAVMTALGVLAPHVIAAKQPLPESLADAALRILREDAPDEIRDLLLALPRKQVDGWLHTLSADPKAAVKKRAKEYAKLVRA